MQNISAQSILPFSQITKSDTLTAGGKGASLGELTALFKKHKELVPYNAIPPGFVITAPAFDHFLHETNLLEDIQAQLQNINYQDLNSLERYSNVMRDMIAKMPFPSLLSREVMQAFKKLRSPYVAVRSSATVEDSQEASWAGELETYLNTILKTLIQNIKKCWSSLFTPRALFYRHEKKLLGSRISVAVVVQKMIQSEVSGICFTVHPVTKDANQMIIEAGYGLGEAIVSGAITPDSYVIDKRAGVILDVNVSPQQKMLMQTAHGGGVWWIMVKKSLQQKQKLTNTKIVQLVAFCQKIEKHYRHPSDIEWAYARGKLYILQSRPITTL